MMSSPFASRLRTNYCPRDEELAQIKALLSEPSQRLKHLDDEIAVLQRALDKLSEERDALSAYVKAHKALMSPIRRLPLDILEHIFVACLPTHRNCVMSAKEAPVILGRICSSWRNISLTTPRLWCRLHIVEPPPPEPANSLSTSSRRLLQLEAKVTQRLEVANTWLRRSGQCPLSISLESNPDPPSPGASVSPARPDLFMTALVQVASRWQNIRLATQPSALETLSRLTEDDVPLLKQLEIVHCFGGPPNDAQWCLSQSGVLHGPSLSKFCISGSNTWSTDLPLRWNQLTALSLFPPCFPPWGGAHLTCEMVFDILSRCPKLETCKLLVHGPPNEHVADHVVDCPVLHTLEIHSVGAPIIVSACLLSHLWLPELWDFTLRGQEDHRSASTADSVVSSLATSPHLETISIDSDAFTKSSLIDFLRGLRPSVKHLHITEPVKMWQPYLDNPALDDDSLAALGAHCPTLQELVLLNCHNVSDEGLLCFIISRKPALKRIEVKFDREKQVDILPGLQSFMADGLESSITYKDIPPLFSPWQGLPDAPNWNPWSASD
ncbi:hypothetical protein MVEN_00835500 [Mycena venus]|uniref:F-box domain-containing protein n=1 Tax=Mycena venus TaxID=2733690 RepID=A0A8H6YG29_9AGAR|nr:hypothetical protein MVEN_00835500 [Mycena venus]